MKRNHYKFRGPHTWALAKEAYLAGETARSVAERLDVGHDAMRRRMTKEGWTRRDHAEAIDAARVRRTPLKPQPLADDVPNRPAPPAVETVAEATLVSDKVSAAEVARRAIEQAARAMAEGRFADAAHLTRTAESIARLLTHMPGLQPRSPEDDERLADGRRRLLEALEREAAARDAEPPVGMEFDWTA